MLYPLLLAAGLLTPQARPIVSVPAPQFTRPPLTTERAETPLPTRGGYTRQTISYSTTSNTLTTYSRTRTDGSASLASGAEAEILGLINADRAAYGLGRLTLDSDLVQTARSHCRDMRDRNYFEHNSPLYGQHTPMDRYRFTLARMGESTPSAVTLGENIFYCSKSNAVYNAAYAHRALMNSPGHRANILNPIFTKAGIAVLRDADGQFWVTEMFLRDSP